MLEEAPKNLPRKELERIRGFLNYVCQTYKPLLPYLNGLHMTIDGFRSNRDEEGWKIPKKAKRKRDAEPEPEEESMCGTSVTSVDAEWDNWSAEKDILAGRLHHGGPGNLATPEDVPKEVVAVPRLFRDVAALKELCSAESPPWKRVRCKATASVEGIRQNKAP